MRASKGIFRIERIMTLGAAFLTRTFFPCRTGFQPQLVRCNQPPPGGAAVLRCRTMGEKKLVWRNIQLTDAEVCAQISSAIDINFFSRNSMIL